MSGPFRISELSDVSSQHMRRGRRGEEIGETMTVMRLLLSARRLPVVMLALALLLALSGSLQAQTQQVPRVFAPLVVSQPLVEIEFGTGVDSQDNLVNPGTVFAYGIERLYYRYTVTGALGRLYRTEWFVDGVRQPQLDDSGTILATPAVLTNFFCSPTLGSCDQPVPRGAYRVRFYIDEVFYREATAVVQ
jgi:hypothetical protein